MELKIDKTGWKKVKLGEVAFEYSKRINDPSKSDYDRFVGSSNIGQWDFRIKSWESTSSVSSAMKLFEPNDYLLVRRSLYASDFRERAPRADFYGVCSGDILTIKENPDYIADGFLVGILNSPDLWKHVVANASGSITRRIHWKDLANYEFLLPPKDQQAQLAELLWAMDEVVEKETRVKNQLESTFNTWLNTEITIKKGWPRKALSSVAYVQTGVAKNSALANDTQAIEVPYIRVANVQDGFLDLSEIKTILIRKQDQERFSLSSGDLLLTEGGDFDKLGRGYIWKNEIPNCIHQNHVFAVRPDSKILSSMFLSLVARSNYGKQYFLACAKKTSNLASINSSQLKEFRVFLPKLEDQNKLVHQFLAIEDSKKQLESQIAASRALQKSLINQIF